MILEWIAETLPSGNLSAPLPHPTMAVYLSVKEAAQLTGKSPSSIRRIIYPIIHDDNHPDRKHIQPSVEDALQLRMKGDNFAWRLSEELLRREVPVEAASEKIIGGSATRPAHADTELLGMLRSELEIKNQQIAQQSELISKQMELISGLSERLREGNVLMGSLHQRLALPERNAENSALTIKTKRGTSTQAEKGSTIAPKSAKPKRGFLARIFG